MPIQAQACCCTGQVPGEQFCHGCYPNSKVSPITVKFEKKPRYPPYFRPNVKPFNFDHLFPSSLGSNSIGASATPCQKCAKVVREKDIQLIRKEQELQQYQRHLQKHGGRKHDYGAVKELEFQLYKKEQEIALLQMEEDRQGTTKIYRDPAERIDCAKCAKYLRCREEQLKKLEQEVVKQMASPYIKIGPNPCDCCSGERGDEKHRKRNERNCLKELNKKEKKLMKKERDIDRKIKEFRKEVLYEAKDDMKKTPDSFIKEVYLNCYCACRRKKTKGRSFDPCTYNPYTKAKSWACTMPFPTWNGSMAPNLHSCTTKCCVMRLMEDVCKCWCCPPTCGKRKNPEQCCIPMRLLRWWVFRNRKRTCESYIDPKGPGLGYRNK